MLSEALGAFGYEVTEAEDGECALRVLREASSLPDLVLLDVQMPRLDGYGVVRHIREKSELSHLPVFALTALAMAGDEEKCRAAGFDDYVAKPVNLANLRAKIEDVIRGGGNR